MADSWDPLEALKNLTMEKALANNNETPQTMAKRLFEENLPMSVMAICHLATHCENENTRFTAAKYVVERTMGPAEREDKQQGRHAWDDIYEKVINEAEGYLHAE